MSKALDYLNGLKAVVGSRQPLIQTKIDEAILEIKEYEIRISELQAQEAKSCEGCVSYDEDQYMEDCEECSLRYKSMFKQKDGE